MSEPVYHDLDIISPSTVTAAAAWTYNKLNERDGRCWIQNPLEIPPELEEKYAALSFVTSWVPQVDLVQRASRNFPDCQFRLSFFGSVGTILENDVEFIFVNGAVVVFATGHVDMPINQIFHGVLEYSESEINDEDIKDTLLLYYVNQRISRLVL